MGHPALLYQCYCTKCHNLLTAGKNILGRLALINNLLTQVFILITIMALIGLSN